MSRIAANSISVGDIERQLRTLQSKAGSNSNVQTENKSDFVNLLKEGFKDVNSTIKASEKASLDMASGKPVNLHQTMLAATKAELGFNLAVQMRNKVVEAYQEVMRMQV